MRGAYTWDDLRRLSLARQFPRVRGRGVEAVAAVVTRVGPMQTQTARSAFLGLAARLPGVTHATITEAYETLRLVRGSTIRGTVHTSTPEQHVWLDRATRVGQRAIWARTLPPGSASPEQVWEGIERFAASWRDVDELEAHLRTRLTDRSDGGGSRPEGGFGRYLAFGHGGLIRRPRGDAGWDGQTRAVYRAVAAALADERPDLATALAPLREASHEEAMAAVVLLHLRSHGPASRNDIAWWSGLGLRTVDAALDALATQITVRPGPDGRSYADVVDPPRGRDDVGTRLLGEFDALLCGYDSAARDRFVTPEQHSLLWSRSNGLMRAPLLHRGRLAGWWRLEGGGRHRRLEVELFADAPRPSSSELEEAAAAMATALGLEITLAGPAKV